MRSTTSGFLRAHIPDALHESCMPTARFKRQLTITQSVVSRISILQNYITVDVGIPERCPIYIIPQDFLYWLEVKQLLCCLPFDDGWWLKLSVSSNWCGNYHQDIRCSNGAFLTCLFTALPDYGGALFYPGFPPAARAMAALCKLPFALRPGLSRRYDANQGNVTRSYSSLPQCGYPVGGGCGISSRGCGGDERYAKDGGGSGGAIVDVVVDVVKVVVEGVVERC